MDTELKCNRLTCRKALSGQAVVTTCSHIFCVDCANELFTSAQRCPACDTHLPELDDVVLCSLNPSNDYKTSVLSGLTPSIILEICGRAISFWQYQIHQENSFQQVVIKNLNEKNAQAQKQLDNVIREANNEINLLNNKTMGLERELEVERRKVREMQDAAREKDREYQKLKNQYDRIKRKALLAPNTTNDIPSFAAPAAGADSQMHVREFSKVQSGPDYVGQNLNAVASGMETHGIQRTPLKAVRQNGGRPNEWRQTFLQSKYPAQSVASIHSLPTGRTMSERSDSADEVERLLGQRSSVKTTPHEHANAFNVHAAQRRGGFRPAVIR